jgi:pSer/pThr/pTyr-binding forkhead associated (FHA) protein
MSTCTSCGSPNPEGSLFCSECGLSLVEIDEIDGQSHGVTTNTLYDSSQVGVDDFQPTIHALTLTFLVRTSGRRVTLKLSDELRVGRNDPSRRVQPDLDLTADNGLEHGVSRMHAMFQLTGQGVMLVDLGSKNGTLLNSYRLPPDMLYPVRDGDQVHFGRLPVVIHIEE